MSCGLTGSHREEVPPGTATCGSFRLGARRGWRSPPPRGSLIAWRHARIGLNPAPLPWSPDLRARAVQVAGLLDLAPGSPEGDPSPPAMVGQCLGAAMSAPGRAPRVPGEIPSPGPSPGPVQQQAGGRRRPCRGIQRLAHPRSRGRWPASRMAYRRLVEA